MNMMNYQIYGIIEGLHADDEPLYYLVADFEEKEDAEFFLQYKKNEDMRKFCMKSKKGTL